MVLEWGSSERDREGRILLVAGRQIAELRAELAFGVVWNRPGLALPDRMIAALAALCSVQRLNHLRRHIVAALDLGLAPRSIVEVFIQFGIYTGLPASEEAMAVADILLDHFWDVDNGGLFTTADDSEQLVVRQKDLMDNATPSANST